MSTESAHYCSSEQLISERELKLQATAPTGVFIRCVSPFRCGTAPQARPRTAHVTAEIFPMFYIFLQPSARLLSTLLHFLKISDSKQY
jgi:hypothetical protein